MILSDRYREALAFAFDRHRRQERKGSGIPYVAHVLGVSSLALEYGADENGAIAALLHDVAEDQGGEPALESIEARFGAEVAAMVRTCSDALETPKPPWKERKVRYLERLAASPPETQLVAVCDKLYNLRTILSDYRRVGEALWDRFSGGREGALWYYRALADAFNLPNPALAEFRREVGELEKMV